MKIGDPFVRHTTYCLQVLEGMRRDDFSDEGIWPSAEPADVDEPSQITLMGQLSRWRELVVKYSKAAAALSQADMLDQREMYVLAVACQRWPGATLEIGTYRGVCTAFLCEVMNHLRRSDQLITVELFLEGTKGIDGQDDYPGDYYVKAIKGFRSQKGLHRIVPIIGDSHQMKPMFFGLRPSMIFLDGDHSEDGLYSDLEMLKFFNYPFICLIHDGNNPSVMRTVLRVRREAGLHFANFHTGGDGKKGLIALSRA